MNKQQMDKALSKVYISTAEACDILGISRTTIGKLIGTRLEAIDISSGDKAVWRIKSDSVKRMLGMEVEV